MRLPPVMWYRSVPIQHTGMREENEKSLWNTFSTIFFFLKGGNLESSIFQTLVWVQGVPALGGGAHLGSPHHMKPLLQQSHPWQPPFPSTLAPPVEKPEELTSGKDKKSLWGDRISTFEILPVTL